MRPLTRFTALVGIGLLLSIPPAFGITVLSQSANTEVTLGMAFNEVEYENPLTGLETVRGYAILEWRDADYGPGPSYEDWTVNDPDNIDGDANEIWMRQQGHSISTTTTIPSKIISIHLNGDSNDGLAQVMVDGVEVARLDMYTPVCCDRAFIVVKNLSEATHTIDVNDLGFGVGGTDVATFGAAALRKLTSSVKWSQPPKADDPRVWYYSAEPMLGPPPAPRPAADDFQCTDPSPIIDAHWWGAQAMGDGGVFRIRFYSNVPAGVDEPYSHPGDLLYQADVAGWTQQWDAAANAWYFSVLLPRPFEQEPGTIYWFSTAYVHPQQGWNWLQSTRQWNDFAVQWVDGKWVVPEYRVDLAYELTVAAPNYKWEQPPVPAQPDNVFYGWNELSWHEGPQIAADDWVCDTPDPVSDIHWWGSYLGWNNAYEPPILPDKFHIAIWTDVPANQDLPFSHPGQVIWETYVDRAAGGVFSSFAGWDYDPRTRTYEACFRFDVDLPRDRWFYQDPVGKRTIYWVSIAAVYPDVIVVDHPWGWKTRPRDASSLAPDDAVRIFVPTTAYPGDIFQQGEPIEFPPGESWDLAFELTSKRSEMIYKWEQFPDLEIGIDVNASAGPLFPPYILADDFLCTISGPITDIHVWGSWHHDFFGPDPMAVAFILSIHKDIPAEQSPTGYSMPGELLWMRPFQPGEFIVEPFQTGTPEGWLDPPESYEPFADTICWMYSFFIDPAEAFLQEGSEDNPVVYWLDVQAMPMDPQAVFGWKTSMMPWNDDAVWGQGVEPYPGPWRELRYPPGHPMYPQSIDLAFAITSEQMVEITKWSQPPANWIPEDAFNGWNELSVYGGPQIVADDWFCATEQPVTDIHWWGSFLGWSQIKPPRLPDAFRITIWTDVPAGSGGVNEFSHPGQVIWETECREFTWKFVGWDFDPRLPAADQGSWIPPEACFKFEQILPREQWFFQEPGDNIYWVSIAAVYDFGTPDEHWWGWKTRPRDLTSPAPDDAVVIWDPTAPVVGSAYLSGGPIWYPTPEDSWDMAFSLTTEEVPQKPAHDLGDAPDSSNSFGVAMTAYPPGGPPGVQASYPTVYVAGSPPFGPLHRQPTAVAYLGQAVTLENEADIGPDADGVNNIIPPNDTPDKDKADDGVIFPVTMTHCQQNKFNYVVTLVNPPPAPLFVNVWCDWNRDGDWDDVMTCPDGTQVPEWAVQNQQPILPGPGTYTITTPAFTAWHPAIGAAPPPMWMRITLSEIPWGPTADPGAGGDGPPNGYEFGETEDYYFVPEVAEMDFGDAPDPTYPTVLPNGARHIIVPGLMLGNLIDAEPNGQPDPTATGDDLSNLPDEDGVQFMTPLVPGQGAMVNVTATAAGLLDAWVDFNGDGSWAEAGDQIFAAQPVGPGPMPLNFFVPPTATPGVVTFARFRYSTVGGLPFVGPARDGEVEDYEVRIECPGFNLEFSLDIASDKELSDPNVDGDEGFDPGDVYMWQSGPVTPPRVKGGRDGFKDDLRIFTDATGIPIDPPPDPPDPAIPPATRVPVGQGGPGLYPKFFDLDGHDQIDQSLVEIIRPEPLQVPVPRWPSTCIWGPEHLAISFEDDEGPGWPVADVPVVAFSPAGLLHGTTAARDEVISLTLAPVGPVSYMVVAANPIADEIAVHADLFPNPDGGRQRDDDDVDSLDLVPARPDMPQPACPVWLFTADHEATFVDPNTGIPLDPGSIYEVVPGIGPLKVIDGVIHLGLRPGTDVDGFEMVWLPPPAPVGAAPVLAIIFGVDDDDPLTPVDESGGLNPAMIYASFLNGANFPLLQNPLPDHVDAITAWCNEVPPLPSPTIVVGRRLFYNESFYDGNNIGINPNPVPGNNNDDDDAIDPNKSPLLPGGGLAPLHSWISHTHGVNGLMFDILNATGPITQADFSFVNQGRLGTSITPVAPSGFLVRPGQGVAGSDRVVITFADDTTIDAWLECTIGTGFGLQTADVCYWGSARGETDTPGAAFLFVNITDLLGVRDNQKPSPLNRPTVDEPYDNDKSGLTNITDLLFVRDNQKASPFDAVARITR